MQSSLKEENYLKALALISEDNGTAGVKQLSENLGLKMPTINAMMKKLHQKGLVEYESYKPIKLTSKGKKEALKILRKHRLTEMFLVDVMGLGWEEVHDIAEQIEHLESPLFFDKMDELLGHPAFDPHGSPIPDKSGKIPELKGQLLSDIPTGTTVTFIAVMKSSNEFLQYLNAKNIRLNDQLIILEKENFDQSLLVKHKNNTLQLSKKACEQMLVM